MIIDDRPLISPLIQVLGLPFLDRSTSYFSMVSFCIAIHATSILRIPLLQSFPSLDSHIHSFLPIFHIFDSTCAYDTF